MAAQKAVVLAEMTDQKLVLQTAAVKVEQMAVLMAYRWVDHLVETREMNSAVMKAAVLELLLGGLMAASLVSRSAERLVGHTAAYLVSVTA